MAQVGSAVVIAVKAVSASSYQNECSSATARWKSACAVGVQEIGKWTLPSVSPSCAAAASGSASTRTSATSSRRAVMAWVLLSLVDVQTERQAAGEPALGAAAHGVIARALRVAEQPLESGAAEEAGAAGHLH